MRELHSLGSLLRCVSVYRLVNYRTCLQSTLSDTQSKSGEYWLNVSSCMRKESHQSKYFVSMFFCEPSHLRHTLSVCLGRTRRDDVGTWLNVSSYMCKESKHQNEIYVESLLRAVSSTYPKQIQKISNCLGRTPRDDVGTWLNVSSCICKESKHQIEIFVESLLRARLVYIP